VNSKEGGRRGAVSSTGSGSEPGSWVLIGRSIDCQRKKCGVGNKREGKKTFSKGKICTEWSEGNCIPSKRIRENSPKYKRLHKTSHNGGITGRRRVAGYSGGKKKEKKRRSTDIRVP